jgi:hypothetical protein
MSDAEWNQLANAVLDGTAGEDDVRRVGDEIAANAGRARDFARLSLLHDAIERASTAGVQVRGVARRIRVMAVVRRAALVAAMIAVVAGAAWFTIGTNRPAMAAAEVLARITSVARLGDRVYIVRAIGGEARAPEMKRSGRPQPTIDGAILYLRAPANYVLARLDGDGGEVITGSDGSTAWIVPEKGPVRVSRDASRFSGALPGSRHGIAFVDPHGDLAALAASYDIALEPAAPGRVLARLVAIRRPETRGGPKRIEIAFDPATAVIRSMRLENLPQARGGPRSVEFELVDDAPLDARFFSHESHHGAERAVIKED